MPDPSNRDTTGRVVLGGTLNTSVPALVYSTAPLASLTVTRYGTFTAARSAFGLRTRKTTAPSYPTPPTEFDTTLTGPATATARGAGGVGCACVAVVACGLCPAAGGDDTPPQAASHIGPRSSAPANSRLRGARYIVGYIPSNALIQPHHARCAMSGSIPVRG